MNSESQSLVPATQQAESEELTVDEVRESLSTTEKGQPANTIGNCRTVFCQDPLLRGAIRLNLLTDRVDIVRDLGWRRSTSALTDTDVKYLLLYFEQNYGLTSEKKLMQPEVKKAGKQQIQEKAKESILAFLKKAKQDSAQREYTRKKQREKQDMEL